MKNPKQYTTIFALLPVEWLLINIRYFWSSITRRLIRHYSHILCTIIDISFCKNVVHVYHTLCVDNHGRSVLEHSPRMWEIGVWSPVETGDLSHSKRLVTVPLPGIWQQVPVSVVSGWASVCLQSILTGDSSRKYTNQCFLDWLSRSVADALNLGQICLLTTF